MSTRFNSQLPARPESIEAVLKVLSQNDELMVKDIARLGRITQSQARRAAEELVASGKVVVRKLRRPRQTLYHPPDPVSYVYGEAGLTIVCILVLLGSHAVVSAASNLFDK